MWVALVPSGMDWLDTEIGGVPAAGVVAALGSAGSGKTSLALGFAIAQLKRQGRVCYLTSETPEAVIETCRGTMELDLRPYVAQGMLTVLSFAPFFVNKVRSLNSNDPPLAELKELFDERRIQHVIIDTLDPMLSWIDGANAKVSVRNLLGQIQGWGRAVLCTMSGAAPAAAELARTASGSIELDNERLIVRHAGWCNVYDIEAPLQFVQGRGLVVRANAGRKPAGKSAAMSDMSLIAASPLLPESERQPNVKASTGGTGGGGGGVGGGGPEHKPWMSLIGSASQILGPQAVIIASKDIFQQGQASQPPPPHRQQQQSPMQIPQQPPLPQISHGPMSASPMTPRISQPQQSQAPQQQQPPQQQQQRHPSHPPPAQQQQHPQHPPPHQQQQQQPYRASYPSPPAPFPNNNPQQQFPPTGPQPQVNPMAVNAMAANAMAAAAQQQNRGSNQPPNVMTNPHGSPFTGAQAGSGSGASGAPRSPQTGPQFPPQRVPPQQQQPQQPQQSQQPPQNQDNVNIYSKPPARPADPSLAATNVYQGKSPSQPPPRHNPDLAATNPYNKPPQVSLGQKPASDFGSTRGPGPLEPRRAHDSDDPRDRVPDSRTLVTPPTAPEDEPPLNSIEDPTRIMQGGSQVMLGRGGPAIPRPAAGSPSGGPPPQGSVPGNRRR